LAERWVGVNKIRGFLTELWETLGINKVDNKQQKGGNPRLIGLISLIGPIGPIKLVAQVALMTQKIKPLSTGEGLG
jgi:hypothetical protein